MCHYIPKGEGIFEKSVFLSRLFRLGQINDIKGGIVGSLPNLPCGPLSPDHTDNPLTDTWRRSFHPGDVKQQKIHLLRGTFHPTHTAGWK